MLLNIILSAKKKSNKHLILFRFKSLLKCSQLIFLWLKIPPDCEKKFKK